MIPNFCAFLRGSLRRDKLLESANQADTGYSWDSPGFRTPLRPIDPPNFAL